MLWTTVAETTYIGVDAQSGSDQQINLDLLTDKGGVGYNANATAYAPLDVVSIYSNVTASNAPSVNQDVTFYVTKPNGTVLFARVARTNTSGIATVEYRIPSINYNANETYTGSWSITAFVRVAQTTVNDTCYFTINTPSAVNNQNIKAPATIQKQQNFVMNITVSHIGTWSKLVVTVFDHAQVPIGSYSTNYSAVQNGNVTASIFIPEWAFTGQATAYICLLASDGSAFAPQSSVNFNISA